MQPATAMEPSVSQAASSAGVMRVTPSGKAAAAMTALWLTCTAVLLFWNLDYYPFWGDEADTVIFARNVWETGDVGAKYGDNLYLYRNGILLENLKNRSTPPLSYYFAAPFWGLAGADHFWLRFPFALCGLATIALLCGWLRRSRASTLTWLCFGGALTFNVSLLLYARQCRYYSLATLLTVGIAYLYYHFDGRRSRVIAISGLLCLLAATHYLHFAALAAALVVDYAFWQRRQYPLKLSDWGSLLTPVLITVAGLAAVFNPLGRNSLNHDMTGNFFADKWKLFVWSFRDMNICEFGVGVIILCAPLVAYRRGDQNMLRLFAACLTYIIATTLLSPQPMAYAIDADIRYLAPLVIPCLYLTVRTIDLALAGRAQFVVPVVLFALATNILNLPFAHHRWRSTIGDFVQELHSPRLVAGKIVSDWLKKNVPPGTPVWIEPTEYTAEQIVETPHVLYAWQLDRAMLPQRHARQFAALPRANFAAEVPVEYIIAFGLGDTIQNVFTYVVPHMADRGYHYDHIDRLDTFFDDRTRAELHWHWFRNQPYDKTKESISVFRLRQPSTQSP